ncbi:hypothetical protein BDV96DRAFT_23373 [Lophiotrema nucula]|uniref:DUF6594 domain-containing protein n=1 Tax=Lophiotrema nucula TaxID=690887 RepID=A0A6A5ZCN3_9PLEO|nr:hypothetical protein BDV96DRAFT_23373 [Lophiotrema nucula]
MAKKTSDVEKAVTIRRLQGYPSFAEFLASDRDRSTVVFRRFDRLSARNLLHLQSELCELEAQQDALDDQDRNGSTENKQFARNWEEARKHSTGSQKERVELALKIREKLKEYKEAILLDTTLLSLQPPSDRVWDALRHKFHNISPGDLKGWPTLGGASIAILEDQDDLVSLKPPAEQDRLTSFVRDRFGFIFSKATASDDTRYFPEHRITVFVTILSTVVAAMLLVGAIVNLYVVKSQKWRLGLIAIYTALFATTVALLTSARRAEVFAATAAYSAVLVVFVSGNLGN